MDFFATKFCKINSLDTKILAPYLTLKKECELCLQAICSP